VRPLLIVSVKLASYFYLLIYCFSTLGAKINRSLF